MRTANGGRSGVGADRAHRSGVVRCGGTLLVVAIMCTLVGCSGSSRSLTASTSGVAPSTTSTATSAAAAAATLVPAQPRLAADPARLAGDLVADEWALRDRSSSEAVLAAAARRQQAAYRVLAARPEWAAIARARIPPAQLEVYDRNVDARRQLIAMGARKAKDTLPAWRIVAPAPAEELLGYYRKAQAATGVGWNHLAAINLIETGLGRIAGVSSAGAHGPMQFLPSTFAVYGEGGDILSLHDSIMAAGRFLAASGFADDRDHALFRYNNSTRYVRAVNDYAAVLAADPAAFACVSAGHPCGLPGTAQRLGCAAPSGGGQDQSHRGGQVHPPVGVYDERAGIGSSPDLACDDLVADTERAAATICRQRNSLVR